MRFLVIGDIILDQYLFARTTDRPNPETSGLVRQITDWWHGLGGAAAVAAMLARDGHDVYLAGVVGRDQWGSRLCQMMEAQGIRWSPAVSAMGHTTTKLRIIEDGRTSECRYDRDCEPDNPPRQMWKAVHALLRTEYLNGVIFQDYGKGVCTPKEVEAVIAKRTFHTYVDPPRSGSWDHYRDASLVKCNRLELQAWASRETKSESPKGVLEHLDLQSVVVTDGPRGMGCVTRSLDTGTKMFFTPARQVDRLVDVTGAGDTVLAALALRMCNGETLEQACEFAAEVAAVQVTQWGVATNLLVGRTPQMGERVRSESDAEQVH